MSEDLRPVHELLPLKFAIGLCIQTLHCLCVKCKLPGASSYGHKTWLNSYTVRMEIWSKCNRCNLWTKSITLIRDSGETEYQRQDGSWVSGGRVATSPARKFIRWLRRTALRIWQI